MAFEKIIGQKRAKTFFETAFESGRIAHAYLFTGEPGVGKEALALEVAKALICQSGVSCQSEACPDCSRIAKITHPDLKVIFPAPAKLTEAETVKVLASLSENPYNRLDLWANPSISIQRIRELRRVSSFKSYEGKGRVVLILECERMTNESANALLKILEEPPLQTHLILTSSRPTLVLPTISSRCQGVKLDPLSVDEIVDVLQQDAGLEATQARLIAKLADGSYRRAMELTDEGLQELQGRALDFFRKSVQSEFTQIAYVDDLLYSFQRDLKKTKELLKLLAYWFRDAMIYRETDGKNQEMLINADQHEVINNFTKSFPDADLCSAVTEIEKSLELMNRNVQINLILIVLLNRLRGYLKRKDG
jgi:DNA polymerase-3 subunit delta'